MSWPTGLRLDLSLCIAVVDRAACVLRIDRAEHAIAKVFLAHTSINCVFRLIAITQYGAWRSPISAHRDQLFRHGDHPLRLIAIAGFGMAITDFGDGDHLRTALSSSWVEVVA